MSGARETAIGIATVLGSKNAPNPFLLTFQNQVLAEAGEIVRLTVAECRDAGIALTRLELDRDLFGELEGKVDLPIRYCPDLAAAVRFVRPSET
ncbi:hypothetical protein [Tsuneonella troitsensis]|uniref:hypothetical protein n=1 Tax=Tsuneonella troitsensis TaxID=292222 RepID=UPI000A505642|nr:hypothetical protein [Tsuneonella troitsensis]